MASKYFWDGIDIHNIMHDDGTVRDITHNGVTVFNDFPGYYHHPNAWGCYTSNEDLPGFTTNSGTTYALKDYLVKYEHKNATGNFTIPSWCNAVKVYISVAPGASGTNATLNGEHVNDDRNANDGGSVTRNRNNTRHNYATTTNYGGSGTPGKVYYTKRLISIPANSIISATIGSNPNSSKIDIKNSSSFVLSKIHLTAVNGTNASTPTVNNVNIHDGGNNTSRTRVTVLNNASVFNPAAQNYTNIQTAILNLPAESTTTQGGTSNFIIVYYFYKPS